MDFSKYRIGSTITLRNQADSGLTGQIMQFHVARQEQEESLIPAELSRIDFPDPAQAIVTRAFNFSYRGMQGLDHQRQTVRSSTNGCTAEVDSTEIWRLQTDFTHPLHLHLIHFQVLSHSGRPGPYDAGWKDTIDLGPGQTANILVRFAGYRGRYSFHCHNLEHEDMSMMGNFEVV